MVILVVLGMLQLISCRKDNNDEFDYSKLSRSFIPFQQGHELIYSVDSTIYDNFNDTIIETSLFRKFTIDSLFNGIPTRTLFRVSVSEAQDIQGPWKHIRVDQWALTTNYFESQIENIRFVHLSFPPNFENTWNVNQFTNIQSQSRYYIEINDTFQLDSVLYTDVLKTENEPKVNQIVDIQHFEVFAKNIGCVYKKISNIETQLNGRTGYTTELKLYEYNY